VLYFESGKDKIDLSDLGLTFNDLMGALRKIVFFRLNKYPEKLTTY
jgi:hypothetical protein